jgi:hypothetical protein
MASVLDYAHPATPKPSRRIGYIALIVFNALVLLAGGVVFFLESSGGTMAPIVAAVLGCPLLLADFFLGGVPSWIYLRRFKSSMGTHAKDALIALSILPSVAGAIGVMIGFYPW